MVFCRYDVIRIEVCPELQKLLAISTKWPEKSSFLVRDIEKLQQYGILTIPHD